MMLRILPVFLLVLLLVLFGWGLRNDPHHVPSKPKHCLKKKRLIKRYFKESLRFSIFGRRRV
jgi:hypothetical protein